MTDFQKAKIFTIDTSQNMLSTIPYRGGMKLNITTSYEDVDSCLSREEAKELYEYLGEWLKAIGVIA